MRLKRIVAGAAIAAATAAGVVAPVALSAAGGTVTAASHANPGVYYRG